MTTLPAIADYELPAADQLPANRVDWEVDPARAILLVHDMQIYFTDTFGADSPIIRSIIGNIQRLRAEAEAQNVPVYFTAQPPSQDPQDRGLLTDFWGGGIQDDGRHEIVDDLLPVPESDRITKWRYDAFVRTDLDERIRSSGRDQLVITGIYTHIGCLMTAASAFMRDVQPFLVADATADFSPEYHALGIEYAARRCAHVLDTDTAVRQLAGQRTR